MSGTKTRSYARATGRVRPHTHATAAGRARRHLRVPKPGPHAGPPGGGAPPPPPPGAGPPRRHLRVRKKVTGSASRPRLVVNRSARHMFAQIVDDGAGRTLAAASTLDAPIRTAEG